MRELLLQSDFEAGEFAGRRSRVGAAIAEGRALVQGAPRQTGSTAFRQSNEFYYLTGVETPHSYLIVDAGTGRSVLYLPRRDDSLEESEGAILSFEDQEAAVALSGVDEVRPVDALTRDLVRPLFSTSGTVLWVPHAPAEGELVSRDEATRQAGAAAGDPWDGAVPRESLLLRHLRERMPRAVVRDLTPVLDELRLVKSPAEIALMRRAGQLSAEAVSAAMTVTRPGTHERELAGLTSYVFLARGARGHGYRPIIASGPAAWHGHYTRNARVMAAGELVLMDAAPDVGYYTSDIGRMWPVDGHYTDEQRALYDFITTFHRKLLTLIRPGRTAAEIMTTVGAEMAERIGEYGLADDAAAAALDATRWTGHLSHPVGMSVHDVGDYRSRPLEPGMAFCVDPMLWVRPRRMYIRCEDTLVVTEDGVEVFTAAAPLTADEIEDTMRTTSSLPFHTVGSV